MIRRKYYDQNEEMASERCRELESDLPADFLELYELLRHIVDQTDLYALQFFEAKP